MRTTETDSVQQNEDTAGTANNSDNEDKTTVANR